MKKYIIGGIKYGIVAAALAYLIKTGKLDPRQISFSEDALPYMVLCVLTVFLPVVFALTRWFILLNGLGIKMPFKAVLRLSFIGLFFNTFMFGAFGGDFIKLAYIIRETNRRAAAAASILVDRVCGLLGLLTIGGVAIIFNWSHVQATPSLHVLSLVLFALLAGVALCLFTTAIAIAWKRRYALLFTVLLLLGQGIFLGWKTSAETMSPISVYAHIALTVDLLLAALAAFLVPAFLPQGRLHNFVLQKVPLGEKLIDFIDAALSFRSSPSRLAVAMLLSITTQAFAIFSLYMAAKATGSIATISQVYFAAPTTLIANVLPVPLGGLGIGENVFEQVLLLCRDINGNPVTGGAVLFLAWRTITYIVYIVCGLPFYLTGKREIKELEQEFSAENTGA